MKQQLFTVGDGTTVLSPAEIDVSEMTFFDELENDCWKLFKDYCATMGIKIVNESNTEDFYIAKQIQEKVFRQRWQKRFSTVSKNLIHLFKEQGWDCQLVVKLPNF